MIRLAVVGTGGMANGHARSFARIRGCKVTACCDIDAERAKAFAERHGIPAAYGDLKEMLSDADIDAVTVVTSDAAHKPVSLEVIRAGKHILCEKPLALNYRDAKQMADAAKKKGVINMVNFSYRNSSAIQKAAELVAAGKLGRIMHFEASYLQSWLTPSTTWGEWRKDPHWLWRLSSKHGSKGVLGDVGVHIVDFAGFPLGDFSTLSCRLKTFRKAARNRIGEYVLDVNDSAVITAEMKNGAVGTIHTTRWASGQPNSLFLKIYGEDGALTIDLDHSYKELQVFGVGKGQAKWRTMKCGKVPDIYERFIKSVKTGQNDAPDFARGAAVQKVLDKCFESDDKGRTVKV